MQTKTLAVLIGFTLVCCSAAFAQVFGPSNFSFLGYPEPRCARPYVPYSGASEYAWRSFKLDVDTYVDCVNEYVEAGDNDVKRIRLAQDEALAEAKRFLASIR
jgi:hypothetical protein